MIHSLFALMDLDLRVLSDSTLSRRHAELQIQSPVRPKEQLTHLVVDSSGLTIFAEGE